MAPCALQRCTRCTSFASLGEAVTLWASVRLGGLVLARVLLRVRRRLLGLLLLALKLSRWLVLDRRWIVVYLSAWMSYHAPLHWSSIINGLQRGGAGGSHLLLLGLLGLLPVLVDALLLELLLEAGLSFGVDVSLGENVCATTGCEDIC